MSEATVDRVLHERPGVRESARAEVQQAIRDLDKHRTQLELSGRKFLVDVVMQSPERFTTAFRAAVEAELPALAPAVVRSRFQFRVTGSTPAMVETLDRIGARGTGRDRQGLRLHRGRRGHRPAHRGGDTGGHLCHRRAGQLTGRLHRDRQPGRGGDRRPPCRPVARQRVVHRPDHAEQQCLPRRGETGDGVPRRTAEFRHRPRGPTPICVPHAAAGPGALGGVATAASPIRVVTPYNQP